ncbi:triacylglycerol lipase 1-like [Neltuma alba]|uniref:triacylglycerol lipase 1-like n=1 Tax=Neltuma alba TaxID=207710 RepID=UPI0010A2B8A9|nr:triacylglycerol lipase 1-like [Prosopis alba]
MLSDSLLWYLNKITRKNCCFNNLRVDFYLQYEPQPSSSKNLHHLFQMIREGTFCQNDYGILKNLRIYGQLKLPEFNLGDIPKSLPLWMAYGGNDALAYAIDFAHTLKELPSTPEHLLLEDYGHFDFILSLKAKRDIYDHMTRFLKSFGNYSGFASPQQLWGDVNSASVA